MLRAFAGDWSGKAEEVPELTASEWRHLAAVRRTRDGEEVEILNGRGAVGRCRVCDVGGRAKELVVESVEQVERGGETVLRVAPPKGKDFAGVLQKAVELGATRISPLITDHVVVPEERLTEKAVRWQAVLVEALKQSGNPWLPELAMPMGILEALEAGAGLRICGALTEDSEPMGRLWEELPVAGAVELWIGPEGDFSEREYDWLREAGCRMVSLGPLVLRVETAAALLLGTVALRRQI